MKNWLFLLLCFFVLSCSQKNKESPRILIVTPFGDIEAELYPKKAPKTVAAFLSYVDSDVYENSSFYRVLKDDEMPTEYNTGLIQGGLWPEKKNVPGIPHESTNISGLSHTDGTLSLARTEAGTATTEFFICIGDKPQLDSGKAGTGDGLGYAAFGKVVKGMDAVRKIQAERSSGDHFSKKIPINNIRRL